MIICLLQGSDVSLSLTHTHTHAAGTVGQGTSDEYVCHVIQRQYGPAPSLYIYIYKFFTEVWSLKLTPRKAKLSNYATARTRNNQSNRSGAF